MEQKKEREKRGKGGLLKTCPFLETEACDGQDRLHIHLIIFLVYQKKNQTFSNIGKSNF